MPLPEHVKKALASMLLASEDAPPKVVPTAEKLGQILADFQNTEGFTVWDMVEWKPGFRETRYPGYGEPAIVVDLLLGNVTLLAIDEDGEVYVVETDRRRLKSYIPEQTPAQ